MSIKPILFNGKMVRAILDGRKTAMRRVVKGAEDYSEFFALKTLPLAVISKEMRISETYHLCAIFERDGLLHSHIAKAPYEPGDVLWVRETWAKVNGVYYYRADDRENLGVFGGWRPSIHMPREAARIWLCVTKIRVERLREIDEAGAEAEGGQARLKPGHHGLIWHSKTEHTAREDFFRIWDKTLKPMDRNRYGGKANPWVWVIEFERCEKPEKCDD